MSWGPGVVQQRILETLEDSPGAALPVAHIIRELEDVRSHDVRRALRSLEAGGRVSRLEDDEAGAVYRIEDGLSKMIRSMTAEQWDEICGPLSVNPGVPPISWEELEYDEGDDQDEEPDDLDALEEPESETPCTDGHPMHDLSDSPIRLSALFPPPDTP